MSLPLSDVSAVRIEEELFVYTHETLREYSSSDVEAMALWAGRFSAQAAFDVLAVQIPAQHALRTEFGLAVVIEADELHRLNVWLYQEELKLIAQLHTHPEEAFHSRTDDAIPIVAARGGLSLVVPDFARGPADIETYAAYRLSQNNVWTAVGAPLGRLVQVIPSALET